MNTPHAIKPVPIRPCCADIPDIDQVYNWEIDSFDFEDSSCVTHLLDAEPETTYLELEKLLNIDLDKKSPEEKQELLSEWTEYAQQVANLAQIFLNANSARTTAYNDATGQCVELVIPLTTMLWNIHSSDLDSIDTAETISNNASHYIQQHELSVANMRQAVLDTFYTAGYPNYRTYEMVNSMVHDFLYDYFEIDQVSTEWTYNGPKHQVFYLSNYVTFYLCRNLEDVNGFNIGLDSTNILGLSDEDINRAMESVYKIDFNFWLTPYQYENLNREGNAGMEFSRAITGMDVDEDEDYDITDFDEVAQWLADAHGIDSSELLNTVAMRKSTSEFVQAMRAEANNAVYSNTVLTVLVSLTFGDLYELMTRIEAGEVPSINIPAEAHLGLFDTTCGGGATLEVTHNPLVLPVTKDSFNARFATFHLDSEYNDYGYAPWEVHGELDLAPAQVLP